MMNSSDRFVAVLSVVVIAVMAPAPLWAQTNAACDAAIAKLDTETRKLSADLDEEVRNIVKDEFVENGLTTVRNHLKEKPASEAVFDLRDKWQKFNSWAETTKAFGVTMEDLGRCINTRGCSLIEFAKRQNKVIELWIQSLAEKGLGEAGSRVAKASSIIKNYVDHTLTTATTGSLAAVNSCIARFEQQVTTSDTAVNQPQQTPQGGGASVSGGGGGGGGKTALKVVGVAAVGVGAWVGLQAATEELEGLAAPTTTGGTTTTSGGGGSSTPTFSGATYRVTATRTCQTGAANQNPLNPGFIEPCNSISPGGSCDATNFTASVSGSTIRDCGPYLNATVTGVGAISGEYNGVCGASNSGVRFSGQLPSSGSASMTATGTCRGNTYTVGLTFSRQ